MDPLSELLAMLSPRITGAGAFDVAGDWAIAFPRHDAVKCYSVVAGECWLMVESAPQPCRLAMGDCVILPPGAPFQLASDPAIDPIPYPLLRREGDLYRLNGGGSALLVGGHFAFAGPAVELLLDTLPPYIHLDGTADRDVTGWLLQQVQQELRSEKLGASLMLRYLTQAILIQALRRYAEGRPSQEGWLVALADPKLRRAIAAIHANPAHRWTVAELAREAGSSRSTFAELFRDRVGQPPVDYATTWRMMSAAHRLTNTDESVASIGRALGYATDSAFSVAFRRVMGLSPKAHRATSTFNVRPAARQTPAAASLS